MVKSVQLDMLRARQDGETAAQACLERAERSGFDTEACRQELLKILRAVGAKPGEELVDALKDSGFVPTDDRAFGAVFAPLNRKGLIRCIGHCARKRGHGTGGGRIWKAV